MKCEERKEKDIDRHIENKNFEWRLSLPSASACPKSARITKT